MATELKFGDGKYTVLHDNGANFRAERHGENWRSLTGDGLVLAMAQDFEAAIEALEEIVNETAHAFGAGWDETLMAAQARQIIAQARGE